MTSDSHTMNDPVLVVHIAAEAECEGLEIPIETLCGVMDFCYRGRRKKPAVMDLLIADDAVMTKLNRRHLGHDGPTDVLAFADGEEEDGRMRLGDVAIGGQVAVRESRARGIPFEQELAFYALHGLLHLLGMDDGTVAERAQMHRIQIRSMKNFGMVVADGFADA